MPATSERSAQFSIGDRVEVIGAEFNSHTGEIIGESFSENYDFKVMLDDDSYNHPISFEAHELAEEGRMSVEHIEPGESEE